MKAISKQKKNIVSRLREKKKEYHLDAVEGFNAMEPVSVAVLNAQKRYHHSLVISALKLMGKELRNKKNETEIYRAITEGELALDLIEDDLMTSRKGLNVQQEKTRLFLLRAGQKRRIIKILGKENGEQFWTIFERLKRVNFKWKKK